MVADWWRRAGCRSGEKLSGGAAQGAAAGAAVGGPWGAVIGGAAGMASDMATPSPAGPSNASSLGEIGGALFDSSGWNINFGEGNGITTERTQTEAGQFSAIKEYLPYAIVGAIFLVAWRYTKK